MRPTPHRKSLRRCRPVVVAAALLASGCSPSIAPGEVETTNPSGNVEVSLPDTGYVGTLLDDVPRPAMTLRTTTGRRFDLQGRPASEATVLFFGYTHCPDVCPTTMADLGVAYRQLPGAARRDVTVVFVTEDPRRDTPGVLRRWLEGFDPRFVGLIGGGERTRTILQQLYVPASRINPDPLPAVEHPPGHQHDAKVGPPRGKDDHARRGELGGKDGLGDDYGVDHSGVVYVFGPDDQTLLYTGGETPSDYAADLTRLVS